MATPHPHTSSVGPDTLITVKVLIDGTNRRFKLALRDLGANTLPQKLSFLLGNTSEGDLRFERFSDSAGSYIALDSSNPAVYKQLYRAAKAKLKLRLRATLVQPSHVQTTSDVQSVPKDTVGLACTDSRMIGEAGRQNTYLETVLSDLPPRAEPVTSFKAVQPIAIPCAFPASCDMPVPSVGKAGVEDLSRPTLPNLNDFAYGTFSIDCNYCGRSVPNEHYHCSICEDGDYDLCQTCVNAGITCEGDDHWLIKRMIKNGRVLPSTTETLSPKSARKATLAQIVAREPAQEEEERTCNSCISQLPASSFVTCKDCPDFDLCVDCFQQGEHGHHPAHAFHVAEATSSNVTTATMKLLDAGRGLQHDAFCDGCDKQICGIRYKCLSCPDFDYCSQCRVSAGDKHPNHRFAPLYEQLLAAQSHFSREVHRGVYCDGPVCSARFPKAWIRGDRYKCSICHDTDFCANCEALPGLSHNKTHPLIKIKTPIRDIVVEAIEKPAYSGRSTQLGDRPLAKNASTETIRPASINAATQVQTIAEVKPADVQPVCLGSDETPKAMTPRVKTPGVTELQAWFKSDSTTDGTTFQPNHHVTQSWTLLNPGPQAWPAGCAVHFIGGDDMRNLDMKHPSSVSSLTAANQSNVLDEPVAPGKSAVFTVLLKSPTREGQAISYWRLKTPDGQAFGQKLWVDITVASKPVPVVEEKAVASCAPVPEPFHLETNVEQAMDGSAMIFPKLDKESPASSVNDISKPSGPVTDSETTEVNEEDDLVDDLADLELAEEETDDGFLTDEEYDILDADDEDFLAEAQRAIASHK